MSQAASKFSSQNHAYLAGPDVFMPDVFARADAKKARVKEAGMTPHFPFDNEVDTAQFTNPADAAYHIAQGNEKMMAGCLANGKGTAVIFANMTPWHGSPSMDVGTAFEMGYFSRLADQYAGRVLIMGYYENAGEHKTLKERCEDHGMNYSKANDGFMRDTKTQVAVEDFGLTENLMIGSAIRKTGGEVCSSFDQAVARAQEILGARARATSSDHFTGISS